ncbi:VOC family protein, partial [Stenotrophomonas maltophilia]|nr:VOC family protein [Stenotrophomonas maltophilia]
MSRERRIYYVEFASTDPAASRAFFEKAFGWS